MILGFKTKINGKPTFFEEKILAYLYPYSNQATGILPKKHTIRVDKNNRWRVGMLIQFATGVRTKNYQKFADGICTKTEKFCLKYVGESVLVQIGNIFYSNNNGLGIAFLNQFAVNDGFKDLQEFLAYFNQDFEGKIIYF